MSQLEETLKELSECTGIKKAVQESAALVERAAKMKCPVGDTGNLRQSIQYRTIQDGEAAEVFSPLEYAPYVEFGTGIMSTKGGRIDVPWNYQDAEGHWHRTSGMNPQPYLIPALNENENEILEKFKEGMKLDKQS